MFPLLPLALLWAAAGPWAGARAADDEEPAKATPKVKLPTFEVILRRVGKVDLPCVGIQRDGQAVQGDCFEVWRGTRFIGYAEVGELHEGWPGIRTLVGHAAVGDRVVGVSPPMPDVVLLTDEPKGREVKELQALCGKKLKVGHIPERIIIPNRNDVLIAMIHGGIFTLGEDTVVQPHARRGGLAICDALLYSQLKFLDSEATIHKEPPSIRFENVAKVGAGFDEGDTVPWYGKEGKRFTGRFPTLPRESKARIVAAYGSDRGAAIFWDPQGLLVADLTSPNGRAGRDPGSKNKLIVVANALGRGPRYARYRPSKPEYVGLLEELRDLVRASEGSITCVGEGRGSGEGTPINSFVLGEEDRPLVVIVGALQGTDWIATTALVRLAEVLFRNPHDEPKIKWLRDRLQIKIVPVLNVYGYEHDKPLNGSKCDLNRNFPYHWDQCPDKARRGKKPLSEPEAILLKQIIQEGKAIALFELGADTYEAGYRIVRARDLERPQRDLVRAVHTIANARLRHRFVVNGDQTLQLGLTRHREQPTAVNWAASLGLLAATLRICGDGEDSLTNHEVAIQTCLEFLTAVALSLEKPPPPPKPPEPRKPPPRPRRRPRRARSR